MYDDNTSYVVICDDCDMMYIVTGQELNESMSDEYECCCGHKIVVGDMVQEWKRSI